MIDTLLSYVAPHSCCGCSELGMDICDGCKHNIISEGFSVCIACMRPTSGDNLCGSCNDYPFDALWCAGWRRTELKALLDRYKFDAVRSASLPLAELLDLVLPIIPPETVVAVVPTAPSHRRERGFDHMERVARAFAKRRQLTYVPLLKRASNGTQHFRSRRERLVAAEGAFVFAAKSAPACVLLVDDILTTGATLKTNARLLREAGVETLYGAIIARQPLAASADL